MGNSNDLYANSTLVSAFLLSGGDTDLHATAMFPDAAYE